MCVSDTPVCQATAPGLAYLSACSAGRHSFLLGATCCLSCIVACVCAVLCSGRCVASEHAQLSTTTPHLCVPFVCRKLCELVTAYVREILKCTAPHLTGSIAVYRAGYSPAERREIEGALFRGSLRAGECPVCCGGSALPACLLSLGGRRRAGSACRAQQQLRGGCCASAAAVTSYGPLITGSTDLSLD